MKQAFTSRPRFNASFAVRDQSSSLPPQGRYLMVEMTPMRIDYCRTLYNCADSELSKSLVARHTRNGAVSAEKLVSMVAKIAPGALVEQSWYPTIQVL